jgi:hypothetical protein
MWEPQTLTAGPPATGSLLGEEWLAEEPVRYTGQIPSPEKGLDPTLEMAELGRNFSLHVMEVAFPPRGRRSSVMCGSAGPR